MSVRTINQFLHYFDQFEITLQTGAWDTLGAHFAKDARYIVRGAPFACQVEGREAILRAFAKSTAAFDKTMDFRMLAIQSVTRLGSNRIRVELISGYGRTNIGSMTAPVAMEVETNDTGITELIDIYDPELTTPALMWIATNLSDADPSYV